MLALQLRNAEGGNMDDLDYDEEKRLIARTDEEDNSILTSAVVSVIRDRAVAGCYGRCAEIFAGESGSFTVPYDFIFSGRVAAHVSESLGRYGVVQPESFYPLYGGEADLIGQLSRLLIAMRENSPMFSSAQISQVNQSLAGLGFWAWFKTDADYKKHLRNAIVHNRFKVFGSDDGLPAHAEFVFLDAHNGEVTAKLRMNGDDLNSSIDILLEGICSYLVEQGWDIA